MSGNRRRGTAISLTHTRSPLQRRSVSLQVIGKRLQVFTGCPWLSSRPIRDFRPNTDERRINRCRVADFFRGSGRPGFCWSGRILLTWSYAGRTRSSNLVPYRSTAEPEPNIVTIRGKWTECRVRWLRRTATLRMVMRFRFRLAFVGSPASSLSDNSQINGENGPAIRI